MFNPTRNQAREFLFEVWRKHRAGESRKRFDGDELLARGDFAADHPVQRAAGQQFLDAFRHHAGDVNVPRRQTALPGLQRPFGDPTLEVFDGLAANGKFDEMKRHDWDRI